MNAEMNDKLQGNNIIHWMLISCMVVLLLTVTFQLKGEYGIPWSGVGFALFVECVFVVLWICIDLVLARVGIDLILARVKADLDLVPARIGTDLASMITLRKNIVYLIVIMIPTTCVMPDLIKNYSSEQSTFNLCMLAIPYVLNGVGIYGVIRSTIKILKSCKVR